MTREEKQKAIDAVERLNALKQFIGYDKDSEIVQATQKSLDMAIKALEQTEPEKCGDCISRQAALEILDDYAEDIESGNCGTAYSKARTSMCNLSSVEPERKQGHWEWNQRTGEYVCSECGCNPIYERTTPDVSEIDKYRFCRWCGAKMEVDNGD